MKHRPSAQRPVQIWQDLNLPKLLKVISSKEIESEEPKVKTIRNKKRPRAFFYELIVIYQHLQTYFL